MQIKSLLFSILFILLLISSANGQNYQSLFGSQSTSWNVTFGYCDAQTTTTNKVIGDTTINAINYKKVDGLIAHQNSVGYLREDTVLGKAWYYNALDSTEYLTMDLSLSKNDTFAVYDYSNNSYNFFVDSVYYLNSRKHIQLNASIAICSPHGMLTFIEGVGTTAGLFFQGYQAVSIPFYMLCQHKNAVKTASNLIYPDTCFVQSIGILENQRIENVVNVFPVPVSTELSIDMNLETNQSYKICIYNVSGQVVLEGRIEKNANTIDVSALQKGVYQIRVEGENEVNYARFIKN